MCNNFYGDLIHAVLDNSFAQNNNIDCIRLMEIITLSAAAHKYFYAKCSGDKLPENKCFLYVLKYKHTRRILRKYVKKKCGVNILEHCKIAGDLHKFPGRQDLREDLFDFMKEKLNLDNSCKSAFVDAMMTSD
jgi:hypothetical protein